jgi:hypothetical protein
MKKLTLIVTAVACIGLLFHQPLFAQERHSTDIDMQKKLEYSRDILNGLVMEDFDKILSSARALNKLGKRKWMENESSAYRTQNQVFWFTTGTLVMAAEQKNIDGATLSYTQMTVSCVNCHKLLRDPR